MATIPGTPVRVPEVEGEVRGSQRVGLGEWCSRAFGGRFLSDPDPGQVFRERWGQGRGEPPGGRQHTEGSAHEHLLQDRR